MPQMPSSVCRRTKTYGLPACVVRISSRVICMGANVARQTLAGKRLMVGWQPILLLMSDNLLTESSRATLKRVGSLTTHRSMRQEIDPWIR